MNVKILAVLSLAMLSLVVNRSVARAHADAPGAAPVSAAGPAQVAALAAATQPTDGVIGALGACYTCEPRYQDCLSNCDESEPGGPKDGNCTCQCKNALCYCTRDFCGVRACLPENCD